MSDKLDRVYELQKAFDKRISGRLGVKTDKETWVKRMATFMMTESVELLDAVNWKWWRDRHKIDWNNVIEESMDMFHILLSLWNHLNLTTDEIVRYYEAKNRENFRRQEGKSSGRKDYIFEATGYDADEDQTNLDWECWLCEPDCSDCGFNTGLNKCGCEIHGQ